MFVVCDGVCVCGAIECLWCVMSCMCLWCVMSCGVFVVCDGLLSVCGV